MIWVIWVYGIWIKKTLLNIGTQTQMKLWQNKYPKHSYD